MGEGNQKMRCGRIGATAALACLSSVAMAEAPQDNFWMALEYFYPTISSTAQIDARATARPGTSIRLEDDLDLDERKGTPYIELGLRLGENWRIAFEYYSLKRSASKTLGRQIDFGDATFPTGATIDTGFNSTIYRVTGGWSFIRSPQAEAGLGFGLHITDFETELSGVGTGVLQGTGFQRQARDQLVPLPTIGLYGTYVLTPQFMLRGRFDYLSLKYQDYDGRLLNLMASLDWRFAKNFGAGVGYRYVDYKLDATKKDFTGTINYTFKGPTIFVTAAF